MKERNRFTRGMFAWAGFKSVGIEYDRARRFAGRSHAHSFHVFQLAIRGIFAFSYVPIRLISFFGILVSIISMAYLVFTVIRIMVFGVPFAGYGTIVSLMLMMFGILFLCSVCSDSISLRFTRRLNRGPTISSHGELVLRIGREAILRNGQGSSILDSMLNLLPALVRRHQVESKFVLIGGCNTIFALLTFFILDIVFSRLFSPRYVAYMIAMVLTNFLSVTMAFVLHKYFTFRSRATGLRLLLEFIRFLLTYILVFALSLALLPLLAEGFGVAPRVSAVVGILISIAVSYLSHSRFSFNKKDRVA